MTESTLIKAQNDCNVFVDEWGDGGIWLAIQTRFGGAHCVIEPENIPAMIEALQEALKETA